MKKNADGSVTLSREELYQQVWTTSMVRLARDYGLSDVGLAKICRRHQIPRPGPGYWARKQHGYATHMEPLPACTDPGLADVEIPRPSTSRPPRNAPGVPAPEPVVVASDLADAHPLVRRTHESLLVARPNTNGVLRPRRRGTPEVAVTSANVTRSMLILDAVVKDLERHGHSLVIVDGESSRGMFVEAYGERVEIALYERIRSQQRPLTPHEERQKGRNPWLFRLPIYEHVPTGQLALQILSYSYEHRRRTWGDGKRQRLETRLGAFLLAVVGMAAAMAERSREEREVRMRREAWEKERHAKLQLVHAEEERLQDLHTCATAWAQSQQLRQYIQAVRDQVVAQFGRVEEGGEHATWLTWATSHADRLDPLVKSPPSILDEKAHWEQGSP